MPLVAKYAAQESFIGKYYKLSCICNQIIQKLTASEIGQVAEKMLSLGLTLSPAEQHKKQGLAMYVLLQALVIDWSNVEIDQDTLKNLVPTQIQAKSLSVTNWK